MIKIILVVGARPNFIKIAPLMEEIKKHKVIVPLLVHTGQHYDYNMSESFFKELKIPKPDINLNVGSGSPAVQTANIMVEFEKICTTEKPHFVLVVGDVNSTLACALVAKKLNIKVIHVEAGLRSFDETMPEEINRVITDRISDLLFITEEDAKKNLLNEGINKEKIYFAGNVMIDTLVSNLAKLKNSDILESLNLRKKNYGVITLHRPSNVDDYKNLKNILKIFYKISKKIPLVFPIHPRTKSKIFEWKLEEYLKNIIITEPLGYIDFINLVKNSKFVLTDSGGIQEETTFLKIPCLTMRENTERPITIKEGTNMLIKINSKKILYEVDKILGGKVKKGKIPKLWDGQTSKRIINLVLRSLKNGKN